MIPFTVCSLYVDKFQPINQSSLFANICANYKSNNTSVCMVLQIITRKKLLNVDLIPQIQVKFSIFYLTLW